MAQRRMFSKTITSSSQFLMMPQSSQNLYFHLGMNADDDGFCEHFSIMRMTDSKPDDLKVLQAKGFVNVFDDRVLVILDWKENNYIRSDRYTESKYLKIYKEELKMIGNQSINFGIPNDNHLATQDRLGKDRIGKDINNEVVAEKQNINKIIDLWKTVNPSYEKFFKNKTQRTAIERLIKKHGEENIAKIIEILPKTNQMQYAPIITTPLQLEDKIANLKSFIDKEKSKQNTIGIAL